MVPALPLPLTHPLLGWSFPRPFIFLSLCGGWLAAFMRVSGRIGGLRQEEFSRLFTVTKVRSTELGIVNFL